MIQNLGLFSNAYLHRVKPLEEIKPEERICDCFLMSSKLSNSVNESMNFPKLCIEWKGGYGENQQEVTRNPPLPQKTHRTYIYISKNTAVIIHGKILKKIKQINIKDKTLKRRSWQLQLWTHSHSVVWQEFYCYAPMMDYIYALPLHQTVNRYYKFFPKIVTN